MYCSLSSKFYNIKVSHLLVVIKVSTLNFLHFCQNSDTRDNPHLEVIKQVLKDVYEVRKELTDISELVATTEDETVSSKIADKTSAATEKLDRVHNYLMESFNNPAEFVLYRAQVSLFF